MSRRLGLVVALLTLAVGVVAAYGSGPEEPASEPRERDRSPAPPEAIEPAPTEVGVADLREPRVSAPRAPAQPPPSCTLTDAEAKPDGPLSERPAIADQQRARARFGLRSDAEWVEEVARLHERAADPATAAGDFDEGLGFPVTSAEARALARHQNRAGDTAGRLRRYGSRLEGFAGLWLHWDRPRGVTIAFSRDIERHRSAISALELHPKVDVRVVAVEYSFRELETLRDQLARELGPSTSVNLDVVGNRVEVGFGTAHEAALATIAELGGRAVCVHVPPPGSHIPEGPQPESGDGWRLLWEARDGPIWFTAAAVNDAEYAILWDELAPGSARPPVDFTEEIVVQFSPGVSGSCSDIRFDGLVVRDDLVYPQIVLPGEPPDGCTADANPHTYVVAIERTTFPASAFRIQLEENACPGCNGTDVAHLDLSGSPIPADARCIDEWNIVNNSEQQLRVATLGATTTTIARLKAYGSPLPGAPSAEAEPPLSPGCLFVFPHDEGVAQALGLWREDLDGAFVWEPFRALGGAVESSTELPKRIVTSEGLIRAAQD